MTEIGRRDFLRQSAWGLAALGAGGLTLRADAQPTESSGHVGDYHDYGTETPGPTETKPANGWAPTEDNILGPFFRPGAPYRAKVTPPLEAGTVLLIKGRVWGFDSKKPLPFANLDIWQANTQGRYDNDDPDHPPAKGVFLNRARVVADETGRYEYETIHPGPYKTDPQTWRPSHIHYWIKHRGYKDLVTQLYFEGDKYNAADLFIKPSLIIPIHVQEKGAARYETGTFDIVLAPG